MSLNVNTSSNSSPKAAAQSDRPTVLIIGAGVAGLSTGSYLQMNGFDTHILERHTLPGGCCTAWTRNGYIFDYCIEWFLGSGSNNDANQVWQELGALDGKSVRDFDLFNRVVDEKGREINFYNDPDRLLQHMNTIAPQDAKTNKAFCDDLRRFTEIDFFPALKPNPLMSWREKLKFFVKVLPEFRLFWRTGATQMETFAQRFNDPLLRKAMPFIFFQDHECFPMLPYLYNMAQAHKGNAGFPQGGSLGVAQSMAERYLELGGKITYGVKATKILLENNKAIGVQSKTKKQFFSDKVVAACDGFTTLYHMLDGKYLNPTIDKLYDVMLEKPGIIYPGVVSVFIGYKGEVGKSEPHSTTFLLEEEEAKSIPGCKQNSLVLQHRSRFAEGFAPDGCSVMHLTYLSDFEEWDYLRSNDKPRYRTRKEQVGENICRFLERRYPGIRESIEIVEIATPVTQKRYTGNTKGSILAWKSFTEAEDLANKLINKYHMQLPGLDNFFMAGQWIGGGSLLRSALSGRYAAQFLCQAEKRPFNVTQSKKSTQWKELYFSYNSKPSKTTPANQGAPHAASTQTA